MGTPLADRIRAKAKETANKPMTPTGASAAMAKQAAVSSTGKAAAPGAGLAQSAVQETAVAQQAEAQQDAIADEVQSTGEDMALTEQAADVKQSGVESQQRQQKLEADNHFNNSLKKFGSRIEMAATEKEKNIASLELKGELQRNRLENAKYKQGLQAAGKRNRLESREDFSIAMSAETLGRGKVEGDAARERAKFIEGVNRKERRRTSMDEIMAALKKSKDDAKAQKHAQGTGFVASMAKTGISAYNQGMFDSDEVVSGDTSVSGAGSGGGTGSAMQPSMPINR